MPRPPSTSRARRSPSRSSAASSSGARRRRRSRAGCSPSRASQLGGFFNSGQVERAALLRLGCDPPGASTADLEWVERLADLPSLRVTVKTALDDLPSDQAYAVTARVVNAREYAELAGELNVTEQVVRARVSRGLRAMAETLDDPAFKDAADEAGPAAGHRRRSASASEEAAAALRSLRARRRRRRALALARDRRCPSRRRSSPRRSAPARCASSTAAATRSNPSPAAAGTHAPAAEDPSVIVASATPDPGGGPPWVLRAYTTPQRPRVRAGRAAARRRLRAGAERAVPRPAEVRAGDVRGGRTRTARSSRCSASRGGGAHARLRHRRRPQPGDRRSGDARRSVQPVAFGAFVPSSTEPTRASGSSSARRSGAGRTCTVSDRRRRAPTRQVRALRVTNPAGDPPSHARGHRTSSDRVVNAACGRRPAWLSVA